MMFVCCVHHAGLVIGGDDTPAPSLAGARPSLGRPRDADSIAIYATPPSPIPSTKIPNQNTRGCTQPLQLPNCRLHVYLLGTFFPPNLRMDILISIWEDLCLPMNKTTMGGALCLYALLKFLFFSSSATLFIRLDAYTDICSCMPFVTEQIWRCASCVPFEMQLLAVQIPSGV